MNVVTFETAKRLKDAGFPQNNAGEILYGDAFYDEDHRLHIYNSRKNGILYLDILAPTATDILKELPTFCILMRDGEVWICNIEGDESLYRGNPAEACAAAWLSLHEKTETK